MVTLHVWQVPPRTLPVALARMAVDPHRVRRLSGLRFAKLLGTGTGTTFGVRDADPTRWALLASWDDAGAADSFDDSTVVRGWDAQAVERLRVRLRPLASRGAWSRRQPFGDPQAQPHAGSVAALTRARIAPRKLATFWRAVPPVAADLHGQTGLRLAFGVGEAPVGWQGTFSVWESVAAMSDFAHRRAVHADAIRRTAEERWYAEELFARFAVLGVDGSYRGRAVAGA